MTSRPFTVIAGLALLAAVGCDSSSNGAGDGGGASICGCTEATAQDLTAQTTVTVDFGGALGLVYSPKCILVAPGTSVSFEGDFAEHPLSATVGTGNPVMPTATGTTAAFTFGQSGAYGYQCDAHIASGMCGAVYVQ